VHAGVLDAEGARRKRARVQREADFYAAMDGAGKFVKGDAIAALIIVVLNLIGGVIVGVAYHGLAPLDAFQTFAILSIGNALVTTLPAFLISTAMGLMVTRVAGEGALGADLVEQLIARPDALRIAGVLMGVLAFVPALPAPLFVLLGVAAFGGASAAAKRRAAADAAQRAALERRRKDAIRRPEAAFALVGVDALSIDIGTELFDLLAAPNADALLDRIGDVRRALAGETGIVIPGVRLRDDAMRSEGYAIRVRDRVAAEGRVRLDRLLAVGTEATLAQIGGEPVIEPVYGLAARAIASGERERAEALGALTFDAISIIGSHLSETVRANASELFGRQELQTLVEHLRATVPSIVKDVGSDVLPIVTAHRAFTLLLRERAWPRDPVAVFEAMLDAAPHAREPREIAEAARRVIVPQHFRRENITRIRPLLIAPDLDAELTRMWGHDGLAPDPATALHLRAAVERFIGDPAYAPHALVTTAHVRPMLADFFERVGPRIDVYAFAELPPSVAVEPAAIIGAPAAVSA
jgi:flagellar biosynthesis protein FlhA